MLKQEDLRPEVQTTKAINMQIASCSDTSAAEQAARSPDHCSGRELCQCVMAKAHSLNEVSSHDLDPDVAGARTSLDAESGPTASRRRRKRYLPNHGQKVSINDNSDNSSHHHFKKLLGISAEYGM